jgi:hypothetical protein
MRTVLGISSSRYAIHGGFLRAISCTERSACSLKSADERLLGELLDDWFDYPSQPKWHVTRQRYGSALDDYTAVFESITSGL